MFNALLYASFQLLFLPCFHEEKLIIGIRGRDLTDSERLVTEETCQIHNLVVCMRYINFYAM